MKILVIGQGGREHALVRALKKSPSIKEVHALPGSDGIAQDAVCHSIDWKNFSAVAALCKHEKINCVVIGPENPLVDGMADALRAEGIDVFGPSKNAAQLEGSKIFCKEFLVEAGVPTAHSVVVDSVEKTLKAANDFTPPYVLKADGLAAGKGVFICKTKSDLEASARAIFDEKILGAAGSRALLEQFQPGYEISYLVLTDGKTFEPLPLAQDHKRLLDGDEGPNTGGMGVVAPMHLASELRNRIDREVIEPTLALMQKRNAEGGGFLYRGVLFVGLMITESGPSVLEFNTRFGDPETQAIMPLLDGDWGSVLSQIAQGKMPALKWKALSSCCVVLAAKGYPDAPVKGMPLEFQTTALGKMVENKSVGENFGYFVHAGTRRDGTNQWSTNGGRVLNAIGLGEGLSQAIRNAYRLIEGVHSDGLQLRKDIGARALKTSISN
jgi:phosphoribosylamine---glycine ligase